MMRMLAALLGPALVLGLAQAEAQAPPTKPESPEPKPNAVRGLLPAPDEPQATAAPELTDLKQKASYAVGLNMGKAFKAQSIDLDPDLITKGLRDGYAGAKSLLTDAQIQEVLQTYEREAIATRDGMTKRKGEEFLAANATKPGVKVTASGLQYKVITEGNGKMPKPTDTVRTNYRGTLIDGTEFDSSFKTGKPVSFGVTDVIKGWTEALQLMKVGSKYQLFIPSGLAYGERPRPGGPITPNAALIFEIELLGIE